MNWDFGIVLGYFGLIMWMALRGRASKDATTEEYFLSNRSLRWPSIALSTIATNIQGYQFLGMMGSAYLYGLAQANLEINAVTGLLMAAFIFVPLYLRNKVITITQLIKAKAGKRVALLYSVANIALLSTVGLGAALFWGAYAADVVFGDILSIISESRFIRVGSIVVFLGTFSAVYTYFGGLNAVVKTDIIQFFILLVGGVIVLFVAVDQLGGWHQLYLRPDTRNLMHLHLPASHPQMPWTLIFGLFLLNINYWCANQSIIQRSLAARSLNEAQIGLLAGGVLKYLMALIIVIPGIALVGILGKNGLVEPDQAFPFLVKEYLPMGVRGIILCALFASLMSTVDSLYNSISTLWTVDIYKSYIRPAATDSDMIKTGRTTILVTLVSGILVGWGLLYFKLENPASAFTHVLNEIRYYVNCGIVVIICGAVVFVRQRGTSLLLGFFLTVFLQVVFQILFPTMNYFVRAGWVISMAMLVVILIEYRSSQFTLLKEYFVFENKSNKILGITLVLSLFILHWIFH